MTWVEWLRNFLTQASPWITVRPWEQGVRIFCGKHRRLLGPGIYFKIPILHSALVYPIRTRTVYVAMQTLRSQDARTVMIGLILRYRIADLFKVLDSLHNPESTLSHLAQGAVGDFVPTVRASELRTEELRKAVFAKIDPERYGIDDFDVLVSDNADLSQRTFRLIQEGRWVNTLTDTDAMGRRMKDYSEQRMTDALSHLKPPTSADIAAVERWRMEQKAARERYDEHIARGGKPPGMCSNIDPCTMLVVV